MNSHQRGQVHQTLREATAAAHHALDHHWLLQRLTGSDLTREHYAESLAAMYRPHARLEQLVHESRHHLETGLGLSPRLESLEADLFDLGWPNPPILEARPDASDERAIWWGRVYVLEGSRLGSAVIARCIQSSLGDAVPRRFFAEATSAPDYRTWLAMLERELEDPEALKQAAASAREAFAFYQSGLDAIDNGKRDVEVQSMNRYSSLQGR